MRKIEKENVNIEKFKKLELNNVSFNYSNSRKKILNNISLVIERGTSIGLVGRSGAGKTTLLDVILGLLNPTEGSISFLMKKI